MSENGETIIYQGRPSWLNYYILYIIGVALFVILSDAGYTQGGVLTLLFVVGLAAIFRLRYLFTITDDRVMQKVGLIARNTNEIKLRHIRGINVRQGIIERLLGIGTIEMSSAAGGGVEVIFKGIRDPHGVKERIRGLQG